MSFGYGVLRFLALASLVLSALMGDARADRAADAAWEALRMGGHIALMRHARAPGIGDPAGFRLEDCATQRTLSAAGRADAKAIGAAMRARAVPVAGVYSSQWCRCLETARLLELGDVVAFEPLNSFFTRQENKAPQLAALRSWIAGARMEGSAIFVTHQVVVTALSGIFPRPGEIVVGKPTADGALRIIGRIPPPS